jgi:spore coat polysaccharide biosynthesis protein SpsF (cytidylyltransferase family)
MSSNRFPGKVLTEINGRPMIFWQVKRISNSKMIDKVVVATSSDSSDDVLSEKLKTEGIIVHRGNLLDVHSRFIDVANEYPEFNTIVRLTADCPLVMPEIIDEMSAEFSRLNIDYLSNVNPATFPDGLDVEIFRRNTLVTLNEYELDSKEREHVTLGIRNRPTRYKIMNFSQSIDLSLERWTVDYPTDLDFVKQVFSQFRGREESFSYLELLAYFLPEYSDIPDYELNMVTQADLKLGSE